MTGGGVYPALAVLQAVKDRVSQVLWVGSQSQMEPTLLKGFDLIYQAIPAAGLHGVGFLSLPGNFVKLARGWRASSQLIKQFKPHVIFYTGGYIGIPMALAAGSIRSVVFIPDIEPGSAHQMLIRKASSVAVSTDTSKDMIHTDAEIIVTGYPVRKELLQWKRAKAREHFIIPTNDKVLLVFGGSKGAQSINRALAQHLEDLLQDLHIIHISGVDNWNEVQAVRHSLADDLALRYHVFPFLHDEMGAALAAADLAVCRAGASILGELPAFSLPAILVPYPHAWRYQARNAQYLAQRGGAIVLEDSAMGKNLATVIREIINDPPRMKSMRLSLKALYAPHAADQIADLLIQTAASTTNKEEKNG